MRAPLAAAALALLLGACGSSGDGAPAGGAAATSAAGSSAASAGSSAPTQPAAGSSAPGATAAPQTPVATPAVLQFKAPLLAGGSLDGTTYTGKPVAFWFWAPW